MPIDPDELAEILRDERPRCVAITPAGNQCKRSAMEDSIFCSSHCPDRAEQRQKSIAKGQETKVAKRLFSICESTTFNDQNSQELLFVVGRAVISGDLSTGEARVLKDLILASKQIRDSSATQHNGLDGSILGMSDDQLNAFIQAGDILDSADLCIDIEPSKTINRGKNMHQVRIDHHEPRTIDLGDDDIIELNDDDIDSQAVCHVEEFVLDCYEELDADKAEELWNELSFEDQVACIEFVRSAFVGCSTDEPAPSEAGQANTAIKTEPRNTRRIKLK